MRDLLEPIFGPWGAVVVQFLLTAAVVLVLIGFVIWLVRRYSGISFGGIGRGRVPRLAVVDEMPIDRRHRLVLVRRDNIEHLLLIGGTSDTVVEQSIQRVRQRKPDQAAAPAQPQRNAVQQQPRSQQLPPRQQPVPQIASAPQVAPVAEPTPEPEPEPQREEQPAFAATRQTRSLRAAAERAISERAIGERTALRTRRPLTVAAPPPPMPEPEPEPEPELPGPFAQENEPSEDSYAFAFPAEQENQPAAEDAQAEPSPEDATPAEDDQPPPRYERVRQASIVPPAYTEFAGGEVSGPFVPPEMPMTADAGPEAAEATEPAPQPRDADLSAAELGEGEAPPTGSEEEPPLSEQGEAAVNDLEREMARLLDEITARRTS